MATFEEVAELASDLNQRLGTSFLPDSLVYLIESFIGDDETDPFEIPISEITEHLVGLICLSDAFVAAQDGEDIEGIEELVQDTINLLE